MKGVSCPGGLHSDLNGALNIIRKAAGIVPAIKKPLSFIVDHNRVTPKEGCNPRNPEEPSPFRAGRGSPLSFKTDPFPS